MTTPTTDTSPTGDYPILPAANRHWLTPFYDLLYDLMGLGRCFQRGVVARLGLRGDERLSTSGAGPARCLRKPFGGTRA